MADKNILLIEPAYKNKYPPLGLMKIAQYHGPQGKRDNVRFIKGEDRSVLTRAWDRVYITTLFSFEYSKIAQTINFALEVTNGQADKIFVGGIAASLMHGRFEYARLELGARTEGFTRDQHLAVHKGIGDRRGGTHGMTRCRFQH